MLNDLHIVYVLPEFVTEKYAGGLATYYDNISRILADSGNHVTVFVLSDANECIAYYPGVNVRRISVYNNADPLIPSSFMRLWSSEMNRAVREFRQSGNRIDVIQYANYMSLGFDRIEDIPTVVRISSFQPYMRAAMKLVFDINKQFKCETAADYLEMISAIKADAVYSPSEILAELFAKEIEKKIDVIESPFYPKEGLKPINACKELKGKKYIVTFSTLNLLKGIKLIGDCIWDVLDKNREIVWLFAGLEIPWIEEDGRKTTPSEYIMSKAGEYADRVMFLGKIKHDRLLGIVSNSEACIMPSRIDNLPNTCIEAMALGKVVVGTKNTSFEQLITHEESGFIVERENKKDLIQTVCRVLQLDEKSKKMIGDCAKKRVELMRPGIIREELTGLYNETIRQFRTSAFKNNKNYIAMKDKYNRAIKKCNRPSAKEYLL